MSTVYWGLAVKNNAKVNLEESVHRVGGPELLNGLSLLSEADWAFVLEQVL